MVEHLAGAEHTAHQKQGILIHNRRLLKRFDGTDQQVALAFENIQYRRLIFFRNGTAAQFDIHMDNRSR
ncbi:hypothetical protein D3C73_1272100 [compost metagenome]